MGRNRTMTLQENMTMDVTFPFPTILRTTPEARSP